jgi:hypothetical protein
VFCESAARGMYERWHELLRTPSTREAERLRVARAPQRDKAFEPVLE